MKSYTIIGVSVKNSEDKIEYWTHNTTNEQDAIEEFKLHYPGYDVVEINDRKI